MLRIHGSHALKQYIQLDREPVDIDVIATMEHFDAFVKWVEAKYNTCRMSVLPTSDRHMVAKFANGMIVDGEIAHEGQSGHDLLLLEEKLNPGSMFVSLYGMYALKMSHRYLKNSPHFLKTMNDIHAMRHHRSIALRYNTEIPTEYRDWFVKREKETYTYAHPKLNVKSKQFFSGDAVNYVYDHDSIHRAIALEDRPAYTRFLVDEVKVSRDLWNELPYLHKIHAVAEESMVLAIERSLVPFPGKKKPHRAYLMALEKVCTSITSGWFREFAWEHYQDATTFAAESFFERFQEALARGEILPYKGD